MRVGGGGGAARERWHRLAARALDLQQMALPPLARMETRKTHDHAETSRNNTVPHPRRGPGRSGAARPCRLFQLRRARGRLASIDAHTWRHGRSEEPTSELQSLMRPSKAAFCTKKNETITLQI